METKLFGQLPDVEVVALPPAELDAVASLYTRVVKSAGVSPQEREWLRSLARQLIKRERLDGIVLAGTNLAFVFDPATAGYPYVDGARLHIAAIMQAIMTN